MSQSSGKGFYSTRNETETQKTLSGLLVGSVLEAKGVAVNAVANLQRNDGVKKGQKGGREQGVSAAFRGSDHGC